MGYVIWGNIIYYLFNILNIVQEPYFHWTFGVSEPDCFGLIQVSTGKTYLFFPKVEEANIIWLGKPLTLNEYRCRYKVEDVLFVDSVIKCFFVVFFSVDCTCHIK